MTDDLSDALQTLLDRAVADGVCSAAVVGVAIDGRDPAIVAAGVLQRIDDDGAPIDAERLERTDPGTVFDLASVTKVFSAVTLLGLVADGVLRLDDSIARWLPEYAEGDHARSAVTLRHLLTHTSGLPATWTGWRAPLTAALATIPDDAPPLSETPLTDRTALLDDLAHTPLGADPGDRWEYACTGFNTAMLVAEAASGRPWGELVADGVLRPLGLTRTGFNPGPVRAAATEHQPTLHRGVVRGTVHDESAWSLGGVAANAGLFAPVGDVLALAEWIRGAEARSGAESSVAPIVRSWLWENQLPRVLRHAGRSDGGAPFGTSLGLRIGEPWMGRHGADSVGHTGFTGTSLQIDPARNTSIVLLTNRVHPSRDGRGVTALRTAVADLALGGASARGL